MNEELSLYDTLIKFQKDFDNNVTRLFALGNNIKGNEALQTWGVDFYSVLSSELPEKAEILKNRVLNVNISRNLEIESLLTTFKNEIGNWINEFIKQLIFDSKNSIINNNSHIIEKRRTITIPTINQDNSRKVFVIHGRNEKLRADFFDFLRSIDLDPIEWTEARGLTENPSPTISDILDATFKNAQAFIVLMTPDDIAYLNPKYIKPNDPPQESEPTGQPRQNVIFEAGMAWDRDPRRTILVKVGKIRTMSDISGIHFVELSNSDDSRMDIIERLKDAGCSVKDSKRRDWLKTGDFGITS